MKTSSLILPLSLLFSLRAMSSAIPDNFGSDQVQSGSTDSLEDGIRTFSSANSLAGTYKCETTTGSPRARNVQFCADILEKVGTSSCNQNNPLGSKCNELANAGDAAIGICGEERGIPCSDAAYAANFIADKCASDGRAGGWFRFDDRKGIKIIVYHK